MYILKAPPKIYPSGLATISITIDSYKREYILVFKDYEPLLKTLESLRTNNTELFHDEVSASWENANIYCETHKGFIPYRKERIFI